MSEQTAEATATETTETPETTATHETKPTETVEFWKAKAREQEKRAKDNASAAKRLAEFEEGAKTAEDRIAELEQQYKAAETARLRSDIAAQHGITAEDRDLFLTGADEDTLTKQAERLAAHVTERKKHGNRAPLQGRTPSKSAGDDEERAAARSLFGG